MTVFWNILWGRCIFSYYLYFWQRIFKNLHAWPVTEGSRFRYSTPSPSSFWYFFKNLSGWHKVLLGGIKSYCRHQDESAIIIDYYADEGGLQENVIIVLPNNYWSNTKTMSGWKTYIIFASYVNQMIELWNRYIKNVPYHTVFKCMHL